MLAEFVKEITGLAQTQILEHAAGLQGEPRETFVITKDGKYREVRPEPEYPDPLELYSLAALVTMIKHDAQSATPPPYFVEVKDSSEVTCHTTPEKALYGKRGLLYRVIAKDVPGWETDTSLEYTEALIAIRTRFEHTADTDYLLKLLSDITNGAKVSYTDNGIASTIVTSKGIAMQEGQMIRPIVTLRPYRTFQEVMQPASEFHIRITERGIRFIAADGNMWKLAARRVVAEFLNAELEEMIADGKVFITI